MNLCLFYSKVHVFGHKVLSLGPELLLKKGKPAPLLNYSILFLDRMKENNISSRTCSVPYVCQNYECSKKIKLLEAKWPWCPAYGFPTGEAETKRSRLPVLAWSVMGVSKWSRARAWHLRDAHCHTAPIFINIYVCKALC